MKSYVFVLFFFILSYNISIQLRVESKASLEIESLVNKNFLSNSIRNDTSYLPSINKVTLFDSSRDFLKRLFIVNPNKANQCLEENCQYCCLSTNVCGSKEQCENSKITNLIMKISFGIVSSILFFFVVYKIYITDAEPENNDDDKIDDKTLNMLIELFKQNRDNKKKFKP